MIDQVQIAISGAAVVTVANVVFFLVSRFKKNGGCAAASERAEILNVQKLSIEFLQKLSDNSIRQTTILESMARTLEK